MLFRKPFHIRENTMETDKGISKGSQELFEKYPFTKTINNLLSINV
jgi:hypothetical protein